VQSMHTVANTVFPISLIPPMVPTARQPRFIANALMGEQNRTPRQPDRRWGTYLGRSGGVSGKGRPQRRTSSR
jgi:hypothetical protein